MNNNPDRAKKTMAEIGPIARDQAWVEPLLIRGWMAVAERDFLNGKKWAYVAKMIAPEYIELPF